MRMDAAIVDLDGTMVDTLGDFEVALNRTLADLDLPAVARPLVERTVGKGSEHLIRSVLGHQLALIGGWMLLIYVIAFRVFRWE